MPTSRLTVQQIGATLRRAGTAAFAAAGVALLVSMAATPAVASVRIPADSLRADLAILREALTALHPGLHRFQPPESLDAAFARLDRGLGEGLARPEFYLGLSRRLGTIRCGHTYANFWNQPDDVKAELFDGADKLPFTFRLVGRRMIVTASVADDARLTAGVEILAIDGVPVSEMLAGLMPLVKGDGSNDAKRLHDLQVSGDGEFEAFDVLHPLVFPPRDGNYVLLCRDTRGGESFGARVPAITRAERARRLAAAGRSAAPRGIDGWRFEFLRPGIARLTLPSFVTWKSKRDWRGFLDGAFRRADSANVAHLVLDIRGNEGGSDEVLEALRVHLAKTPVRLPATRRRLRYEKVPGTLNPHLETWDDSFRDRGGRVRALGDGFYAPLDASDEEVVLPASDRAFRGRVWLLVDAANSSATFTLASLLQRNRLATLVGEPTGGNRRGTTGGQMFFLRLPHSRIEVDIPLIAGFPAASEPDAGLDPDVVVAPTVEDVVAGRDIVLESVLRLIAESGRQ